MILTRRQKLTILRDALALMTGPEGGWARRSFMTPTDNSISFCAVGAINFASWQLGHREAQLETRIVTEALGLDEYCRHVTGRDLIELNDHQLTTEQDVVGLLTDFMRVLEKGFRRCPRTAILLAERAVVPFAGQPKSSRQLHSNIPEPRAGRPRARGRTPAWVAGRLAPTSHGLRDAVPIA